MHAQTPPAAFRRKSLAVVVIGAAGTAAVLTALAGKLLGGDGGLVHRSTSPASSSNPAPSSASSVQKPEEVQADGEDQNLRRHLSAIARHQAEPIDTAWSNTTADVIRAALSKMAKASTFRVKDVDCRTESCVAAFEWNDYDAATREWQQVINYSYGVACGVSIYLPEPKNRRDVYHGSAIYGCARQ